MKYAFVLFVALAQFSFSQEKSHITVVVEKSIELKAESFVYEVKMGNDFGSLFESLANSDEYEEDYGELDFDEITIEELQETLKKEKFTYTLSSSTNYNLTKSPVKESILVNLSSVSELDRLKTTLQDLEGISGSIKEITYEDISSKYETINEELLKNAQNQAGSMIKGTGKKLGDVYSIEQVEEAPSMMDSFWGDYQKQIMSTAFGMGNEDQTTKEVTVKYRYSFELN